MTDKEILDWLEANPDKIQITRQYVYGEGIPGAFLYRRLIGMSGARVIWSEKAFSSLRELAIDALNKKRGIRETTPTKT